MPNPVDTGRFERLVQCHQRNKFSALFSGIPYGEGTVEVLETGSILSMGADGIAMARKFSGPRTASPNPYASGINMLSKDLDRAMGFPKIGGSPLGKYYKPIGNVAAKSFLIFGALTFAYNTTIDIQCICEQLQ